MTAEQLRGREGMVAMCESDNFRVFLAYFMENCPHIGASCLNAANQVDPNAVLRNEGKVQGYMGLLREMRTIHIAPKKPEKDAPPARLYPEPTKSELNQ